MNRNDKKIFFDQYNDGSKDFYEMSYGQLVDAVGIGEADDIWNEQCWISIPDGKTYDQIIQSYIFD